MALLHWKTQTLAGMAQVILCQNIAQGFMTLWPTLRCVITLLLLMMAAMEIIACPFVSGDSCIFASHSTSGSDEGCTGDGCLCCCAHIVVVAPTMPLATLGFNARAVPLNDIQILEVRSADIEHPPRF